MEMDLGRAGLKAGSRRRDGPAMATVPSALHAESGDDLPHGAREVVGDGAWIRGRWRFGSNSESSGTLPLSLCSVVGVPPGFRHTARIPCLTFAWCSPNVIPPVGTNPFTIPSFLASAFSLLGSCSGSGECARTRQGAASRRLKPCRICRTWPSASAAASAL